MRAVVEEALKMYGRLDGTVEDASRFTMTREDGMLSYISFL